jgi:hypothetical protein
MRSFAAVVALALAPLLFGSIKAGAQSMPFTDNFDGRAAGNIDGQNGWSASPSDGVQVQTTAVHDGTRAATLAPGSSLWRAFTDQTATNVWIDIALHGRHAALTNHPVLSRDAVAGIFIWTNGSLMAYSNDTWVSLNRSLESNKWHRLSVNLDYVARKWSVHLADDTYNALAEPLATNLTFSATATNRWFHRLKVKN